MSAYSLQGVFLLCLIRSVIFKCRVSFTLIHRRSQEEWMDGLLPLGHGIEVPEKRMDSIHLRTLPALLGGSSQLVSG